LIGGGVSWRRMDPATRGLSVSGTGKIIGWLMVVLLAPSVTFFATTWIARRASNAAGAALVAAYTLVEAQLPGWPSARRGQVVAIKIPTDPQYLRELQREGVAIHGLVHPNIVRAIGFDPYADPAYLTMEYIPGTSLRPLIASKTVSPNDAVAIMRQVLAGLKY